MSRFIQDFEKDQHNYHNPTICFTAQVQNLHFLAALSESDTVDDYEGSLCSVYDGTEPMQNHDVVWFPCPFKQAQYFKFVSITSSGHLDVCEIELYGY